MGDVCEVFSISEPCGDVIRSLQIFKTTVKHEKSLFPLDMDCVKVTQILGDEDYGL